MIQMMWYIVQIIQNCFSPFANMYTPHLDSLQCLNLLQRHCPMTTMIRSLLQKFQEVSSLHRMSQVKVHRRFPFSKSFSPFVGTRGF